MFSLPTKTFGKSFDLSKMTQAQLRDPPQNVSEFLKDDVALKTKRWSLCTENDKKEVIFFLLQKVFCSSITT